MKKEEQSIILTIILLYGTNMALTMKEEITLLAEIYEQHLVPAMFEPFARDLIRLCDIRRSDRILDVACGTGIVSRLAIDYVEVSAGKVVGVDINSCNVECCTSSFCWKGYSLEGRICHVIAISK